MFVMVVIIAVVALVLALLLIAVVVGARHEHPTDLATRAPTVLAALARQVLGLYVRRAVPTPNPGPAIDADQPGVLSEIDAS